jgi:hypothetical protein
VRVNFVYAPDPFHSAHQNFGNKYMPIWAFVLAYVPLEGRGYGNLLGYVRSMLRYRVALGHFLRRIRAFAADPRNLYYAAKGLALVVRRRRRVRGGLRIFVIWMYGWTNFALQHSGARSEDFDVESVEGPIEPRHVLPEGYADETGEDIPLGKTRAQRDRWSWSTAPSSSSPS